jgi:hypothetical protein
LFRSECAPGRRYLVNNYVSESDEQASADLGPQVNQAAIVENKRRASCALCFDSGMPRGATDAVIASADDGFILPRGFDQRHLASVVTESLLIDLALISAGRHTIRR